MNNSKLYSALTYFDKYEQNRLRKYINSPYFNKNEGIIYLFEILTSHINKYRNSTEVTNLDKEAIWKKIYHDKKYDDIRFRKLNSDLLKLVEGFLAQQTFENNQLNQSTCLLTAVEKKSMNELFESSSRIAKRISKQQAHITADFFYYQYQIEKSKYEFNKYKFEKSTSLNVEEIGDNLDKFYIAEKLKYYSAILPQAKIATSTEDLLFFDQIINHVKKNNYADVPSIALYYQIYLTISDNDNVDHYFKLRELLVKFGDQLSIPEAKSIYDMAVNYCVIKNNQGQSNFVFELFEVYKDYLENGIIDGDGELAPRHFRNVVNVATRIGKYEWTEQFINDFKDKLPEDFRNNAVSYNLARLYFFQKEYNRVIESLQEVEYEDVTYNIGSKVFLLKIYYELDETEPLFSIMESFRVYLNRHKEIPLQRRKNYFSLIKFTKKLINLMPGNKKELEKIKAELAKTESAIDPWILEKIKEKE